VLCFLFKLVRYLARLERKASKLKRHLKILGTVLFLFTLSRFVFAQTNEDCLTCHGDKSLTKEDSTGKEISLYVDEAIFQQSIHRDLSCVGCHAGVKAEFHATTPEAVNCGECHSDALEQYKKGFHGQKYLEGVKDAPTCRDCHDYHNIRSVNDPTADTYRTNQPKMCAKCHADVRLVSKYQIPVPAPYKAYMEGVHGKGLEAGNIAVAVCSDCHKSHDIRTASDPTSLVYRTNIPSTCGGCHPGEEGEYSEDVHGKGVKRGVTSAPVCTDCHDDHAIKSSHDKTSPTFPANISKVTCNQCHSSKRIIQKYGLVYERVATYLDTYHGVGSRSGDTTTASCVSCHTSHNIRPQDDPLSSINKVNLPQTCGKCHKGAGPNFAKGSIHIIPTSKKDVGVYWVRRLYISLIVVVIGGMLLHNSIVMLKHIRDRYKEAKGGLVVRFVTIEVLWHFLLMISFTTLIITGFAFRFPDAWWSSWMTHSPTAFAARGVAHRVAGVIFIGLFLFSFAYSVFTKRGWQEIKAKFPVLSDVRNVSQNLLYSFGLSSREPLFDRYNYAEKAEYWALIWGGFVMILTGLPLWFETTFLKFMPKWLLDVFKSIHYYEAWLATLAILVWHMFYMIFDPETYPVNWSFITGRMTEEQYMKRHPLDYEKMLARGEMRKEEWLEEKPIESESEEEKGRKNQRGG
jgi:cytochrome b subunit of formate dehydrogenase